LDKDKWTDNKRLVDWNNWVDEELRSINYCHLGILSGVALLMMITHRATPVRINIKFIKQAFI
jgi:hypothetical protein